MSIRLRLSLLFCLASTLFLIATSPSPRMALAQNATHDPAWWDKYQFILNNGADGSAGLTTSELECGRHEGEQRQFQRTRLQRHLPV